MSTVGTKKETDHPAAREATSNQASKPQAQPPRVGRLRLVKKVRLPDVASEGGGGDGVRQFGLLSEP